jgi:putative endonuclease
MPHFVYILYSPGKNRFYIGESVDPLERLNQHNRGFYFGASTKISTDWVLFWSLQCQSKSQALRIESHIKRMRNRQYYFNLAKYPEISESLLLKYK